MILNTGNRTDIPAYYSEWFYNRINSGYVLTRNPFNPKRVIRYELSPDLIDVICFCTKNPYPMLERLSEISHFKQFWFVSITPYGKDIEPNVPNKHKVIESFQQLSEKVGINNVSWRYDPILINDKYTIEYHLRSFEKIAASLENYTNSCVISFIDLYQKTKRNFPRIEEVSNADQEFLASSIAKVAEKYNIRIYTCSESEHLKKYGIDVSGCMTKEVLEKAVGYNMTVPSLQQTRPTCNCILGSDIGMYNTCLHGCRYCYANYNNYEVQENARQHDVNSPLLVGGLADDDVITRAKQQLYYQKQTTLF